MQKYNANNEIHCKVYHVLNRFFYSAKNIKIYNKYYKELHLLQSIPCIKLNSCNVKNI